MSVPAWSEAAIRQLIHSTACPVCAEPAIVDSHCRSCGADYRGAIGGELWEASLAAASALRARQTVLDRVPRGVAVAEAPVPATAPADVVPVAAAVALAPPADPAASATVQSILAIAGAGLVAVAALVFTFFNPDLTDRTLRTVVVGVIAGAFGAGAWMLTRRDLRMSAEAVGALGMVFLALVIGSLADGSEPRAAWAAAASGALVVGSAMAYLGWLLRLRTWLWSSLLALAAVPALFGPSAGEQVAVTVGALGSAAAALALVVLTPRLATRFEVPLTAERVALTVAQGGAVLLALASSVLTPSADPAWSWIGNALVLGAVSGLSIGSARHPGGAAWAFGGGVAGVGAFVLLPLALVPDVPARWMLAALPVAGVIGVAALFAITRRLRRAPRRIAVTGALLVLLLASLRTALASLLVGAAALLGVPVTDDDLLAPDAVAAVAVGLAALALGLWALAALDARRRPARRVGLAWLVALALWCAAAAALTVLASPAVLPAVRLALAVLLAGALSAALPRLGSLAFSRRLPLVVGAHGAIVLAGVLAVRGDALLLPLGGAAAALALLALARTVPIAARFLHVGGAYAFALVVLGLVLDRGGLDPLPLLCVVTAAGGLGAIAATFAPVPPRAWWAILVVTSVPFVTGVVQVVFERSAWTALSTGVVFLLALALTVTRRAGLGIPLRAAAAGILVPSLAVVAVCLGAQFLATSGSPVVLPVIAALVAVVLPARRMLIGALLPRIGGSARSAAIAIELSTLLTGGITVALALVREAAGPGTAIVVLLVLAVGGAATAHWAGRRYGWWLAGAAATGALWCAWALAEVALAEAYLLPPALGAIAVALVLAARGRRALPLYGSALALAVVPLLVLLAVAGSPDGQAVRAYGLVTAAVALVIAGMLCERWSAAVRALAPVSFLVAIVAGAAGATQAVRWGLDLDPAPASTVPLIVLCLGMGAAGAIPAAVAGARLAPSAPWRRAVFVPATVFVPAAAWTAIAREWPTVWTMWALMLALLVGMVAVAARGRRHATALPPVTVLFLLAFVTAVVAWSPRDLRVEWFSLPLGVFLLAAGALGTARREGARRTIADWPNGGGSSWVLLAPGILVALSASIAATYTDPLTWRAILVIVIALAGIVLGATLRLAAPFVIGIVVLPVENALAFLVQIGRGIESMPWWITLSVVGAVLLVIAATYERRSDAGFVARLRDLR